MRHDSAFCRLKMGIRKITGYENDFLGFPRDISERTQLKFVGIQNPTASSFVLTLTLTSYGEAGFNFFPAVRHNQHRFPPRSGCADCSESIAHCHTEKLLAFSVNNAALEVFFSVFEVWVEIFFTMQSRVSGTLSGLVHSCCW